MEEPTTHRIGKGVKIVEHPTGSIEIHRAMQGSVIITERERTRFLDVMGDLIIKDVEGE